MARTAFLLMCLFGLSGCEAVALTFIGTNMATVIHADKTIPDLVISARTEENCSLLHTARNEPYCQSYPPNQTTVLASLAATRYCYRTLGRIDCYQRPDYLASGLTRVDFGAGYLPQPNEPAVLALRDLPGPAMAAAPDAVSSASGETEPAPMPMARSSEAGGPQDPVAAQTHMAAPSRAPAPLAQIPPLAAEPGQGTY